MELREARERDERARRALEGVRDCVEQREVLEVRCGGEEFEERVEVDRALDERERADRGGEVRLERQRAAVRQAGEQRGLGEERFGREGPVAAVVAKAVLGHPEREVFERGQRDVPRAEQAVEVVDPVAKDVRVQTADPRRVRCDERAKGREAAAIALERSSGMERERCKKQCAAGSSSDSRMTVQRDGAASAMCRHLWQTCETGTTEAPPPRKLNTWRRSSGGSRLISCSSPRRTSTCCRTPSRMNSISAS